jgi:hypothetical protein
MLGKDGSGLVVGTNSYARNIYTIFFNNIYI